MTKLSPSSSVQAPIHLLEYCGKGALLWIHLPSSPAKVLVTYPSLVTKLIKLGREKSRQHFSKDPDRLILPYTKEQLNWLSQNNDDWVGHLLLFVPG